MPSHHWTELQNTFADFMLSLTGTNSVPTILVGGRTPYTIPFDFDPDPSYALIEEIQTSTMDPSVPDDGPPRFLSRFPRDFELPVSVGIELEFATSGMSIPGLNHRGSRWKDVPDWIIKTDSSCGFEVTSPVVYTANNLIEQVHAVIKMFKHRKVTMTRSCGFHVHLGVGRNLQDIGRLLRFFARYEDVFVFLAPQHRRTNPFCQPLSLNTRMATKGLDATRAWDSNITAPSTRAVGRCLHRYQWLNCSRYDELHTTEIRLMESTQNAGDIIGWTLFLALAAGSIMKGTLDFSPNKSVSSIEVMMNNFMRQTGFYDHLKMNEMVLQTRKWVNNRFKRVNGFSYRTRLNERYPVK